MGEPAAEPMLGRAANRCSVRTIAQFEDCGACIAEVAESRAQIREWLSLTMHRDPSEVHRG